MRFDRLKGPCARLPTQVPSECREHDCATDERRNAWDFGKDQPTPDRCDRNLQCADQGGLRGSDPQHPFSQQHRGRSMNHTKSSQEDQFIRRDFEPRSHDPSDCDELETRDRPHRQGHGPVGMTPHDDHHQRHQRSHPESQQVTDQSWTAGRAAHHDNDAGEADPGRSQGGEARRLAHPHPRNGGGSEGRDGIDDDHVGDGGVLERRNEADGRRTAGGCGRPSRPPQPFPVRERGLASTRDQPDRHHSSGQ